MQESEGVLCMSVSFRIALAGQVIGVSALYEQTRTFCKNYLTDAPASFKVAVTPADIAFEREKTTGKLRWKDTRRGTSPMNIWKRWHCTAKS